MTKSGKKSKLRCGEQTFWLVGVKEGLAQVDAPIEVADLDGDGKAAAKAMIDNGRTLVMAFVSKPDRAKVTTFFVGQAQALAFKKEWDRLADPGSAADLSPDYDPTKGLPEVVRIYHRPKPTTDTLVPEGNEE